MTISPVSVHDVVDEGAVEALADSLFGDLLGAMNTFAVAVGYRLGWYDALAESDDLSSEELAEATGTDERYTREWLEQQVVAGFLSVVDAAAGPIERRFALSASHGAVLSDSESLAFMAPFAEQVSTFTSNVDGLIQAYRTGAGFGWHEHGQGGRCGQAAGSKPMFLHQLAQEYLANIPGLDQTLETGGLLADVGCGLGWSSIGIALAYPEVQVHGFDLDEPSIELARANAERAGVAERVSFSCVDVGQLEAGGYDAAIALECIHDMSDPVSVLSSIHRMVKPDGTVVVMDERVGERFTGEPDPIEQLMYGFSLICCLADGRNAEESVATGTVMRPDTLRAYAKDAGYRETETLPLEHDTFRFYLLHQ